MKKIGRYLMTGIIVLIVIIFVGNMISSANRKAYERESVKIHNENNIGVGNTDFGREFKKLGYDVRGHISGMNVTSANGSYIAEIVDRNSSEGIMKKIEIYNNFHILHIVYSVERPGVSIVKTSDIKIEENDKRRSIYADANRLIDGKRAGEIVKEVEDLIEVANYEYFISNSKLIDLLNKNEGNISVDMDVKVINIGLQMTGLTFSGDKNNDHVPEGVKYEIDKHSRLNISDEDVQKIIDYIYPAD